MSGTYSISTTIAGPRTITGGLVSVTKSGGVTAADYAITLSAGSLVSDGLLSGGASGLLASGGYAENLASGTIAGGTKAGVSLSGSALLVNDGLISGAGLGVGGAGFVTNDGTIGGSGTAGYAVSFAAGATSALVVDPGARFLGTVKGGGTASTLEFAGTRAASFTGLGSRYTGFGQIDVALGANWTASGANSLAAGQRVTTYGKLVAAGTVTNAATIAATIAAGAGGLGVGIYFAGGMLTNSGALYGATDGLRVPYGAEGTITNSGIVSAASTGSGAYLVDATFFNQTGGSVDGASGIELGAAASLVNTALVSGTNEGVYSAGGVVTNAAGGTIVGGTVGVSGYGMVDNAGTIAAGSTSGFAVAFAGTRDSRLVVDPGAAFVGTVDGGDAAGSSYASTLEMAAGAGTLAGFGVSVLGFGQISLDPGADWLLEGTASGFGSGETITDFAGGSTIELVGTSATSAALAGGVLTLSGGTQLALPGVARVAVSASGGNTFITACFVTGTKIMTARGPVGVEDLYGGMKVVTASGRLAPIAWIGRRRVRIAAHPRPFDVMPVRVHQGAFGGGRPWRDLVLSPDHAVLVDGRLIPTRYLINGVSILQERCETVTYWHLELDRHDVVLAEGLACESYLDTGNRAAFENAPGAVAMTPRFARGVWVRDGCAAIVTDFAEPALRAAHTRLLAHARRERSEAGDQQRWGLDAGGPHQQAQA